MQVQLSKLAYSPWATWTLYSSHKYLSKMVQNKFLDYPRSGIEADFLKVSFVSTRVAIILDSQRFELFQEINSLEINSLDWPWRRGAPQKFTLAWHWKVKNLESSNAKQV